jgi:crossover junction endodeoxyribonuclease RuvC
MIILGIDPGSRFTGYGIIEEINQVVSPITHGVLRLQGRDAHVLRLKVIFEGIGTLIEEYKPDEVAVEMPIYGKNPQSMLKLGRAQAAAALAALTRGIPVTEYTPKEIKKSVTGRGGASKEQVWYMLCRMLSIQENRGLDASDALAVAVCHAHRNRLGGGGKPAAKSWTAYLKANPDRIVEP